jgi:integrase/recombinase XerD
MFAAMIRVARLSGAREEELASLRWSQVDLNGRRLTIIGKVNKLRVIELRPPEHHLFRTILAGIGDAFVFQHHGGQRFENVASRFALFTLECADQDPAFKRFTFHHLRHLHAVEYLRLTARSTTSRNGSVTAASRRPRCTWST